MTTEKAIEQLKSLIQDRESKVHRDDFDEVFEQDIEALKVGISALEKQVPKKSDIVLNNKEMRVCPNCHRGTYNPNGIAKKKIHKSYCIFCGQALDWSEGNE